MGILPRQVELNFRGNHREQPVLVEAGQYVLQYHARLKRAGGAIAVFHRQQDLRVVLRILCRGAQGTGDRDAESIRLIIQQGGYFPFLIHRVDGEGKVAAFFQIQHALYRETLAAHNAVDIVEVNVNMFCLRVTLQIIRHFHGNVVLQGINFFIKPQT